MQTNHAVECLSSVRNLFYCSSLPTVLCTVVASSMQVTDMRNLRLMFAAVKETILQRIQTFCETGGLCFWSGGGGLVCVCVCSNVFIWVSCVFVIDDSVLIPFRSIGCPLRPPSHHTFVFLSFSACAQRHAFRENPYLLS